MATKDFNISPYYDDYDSSKGYHRVLFKPSFAVQARELTQLQTILQNQVKYTSDFNNGKALIPGEIVLDTDLSYVALTTDLSGTDTISNIVGTVIGTSDGVYARIVSATIISRLFVNTLSPASDNSSITEIDVNKQLIKEGHAKEYYGGKR